MASLRNIAQVDEGTARNVINFDQLERSKISANREAGNLQWDRRGICFAQNDGRRGLLLNCY